MKKDQIWISAVLSLGLTLTATTTPAGDAMLMGDAAKGKTLHNARCTACHDSSPYTRKNRRINSIEGLIGQVNRCNQQLTANLSDDQIDDIVKYLNDTYYKF